MKFNNSTRRISRHLLAGSVALLAVVAVSCTSTGTGPDGKPLAYTTPSSGSVLADTLQSAADQTKAAENTAQPSDQQVASAPEEAKSTSAQVAIVTPTDKPQAEKQTAPATTTPSDATATQTAPAEEKPKESKSLFSLFSNKSADEKPVEVASADAEDKEPAAKPSKPESSEVARREVPVETQEANQEKPVQLAALADSARIANAFAPQRPDGTRGNISRLFSDPEMGQRSNRNGQARTAVARAPAPRSTHDYNFSLPGVRPNGGIEIKHRNSLNDDSDIDANEYDGAPGITLASAPGLGRLVPNGLRVRRETVDVACLKPQLVAMLKTMERHFRRPVFVTSGYSSPSYNRKVNGARRSLHMICAAADIQIDGVSKWEIARYARAMPGRGGVGTYCSTTAVHIDVGPERDWNWRCKG